MPIKGFNKLLLLGAFLVWIDITIAPSCALNFTQSFTTLKEALETWTK